MNLNKILPNVKPSSANIPVSSLERRGNLSAQHRSADRSEISAQIADCF